MNNDTNIFDRREILDRIRREMVNHIGWRNAIPMRVLAERVGVKPNQLRADKYDKDKKGMAHNRNLIAQLCAEGLELLSCSKGYYLPRTERMGADEDRRKCESWIERHGIREIQRHRAAMKAPGKAVEMRLFE